MIDYEIIKEIDYIYDDVLLDVITKTFEVEKVKEAVFNIIFVSEKKILEINKEYRNKDSVTDVISFALNDDLEFKSPVNVLGDIYICIPRMIKQAKEYNHSQTRELCFLTVHGLLHLLGYDHIKKEDEEKMFRKQEVILNEFDKTRKTN